jgi:HK97 family phage prohead protease
MKVEILRKGVKQMKVSIRADSVLIEGYVNAIERDSKPLMSRIGRFIERICKGAFSNALKRNDDVHVLLNHDWTRDLGSTKQGNLELKEDNIGLHARAVITDSDVVQKARSGDLVGWSFGFQDREVEQSMEKGLPLRSVKDLDLFEVSILDRTKTPAYDGTLIMARSEDDTQFYGEAFLDELEIREEQTEETEEIREENQPQLEEHPEANTSIDYSKFEAMILEMKGETK